MKGRLFLAALGPMMLAGCAVGPDYHPPLAQAPAQGAFVESANSEFTQAEPPRDWWKLFDAPALDRLIEQALAANTDLRVAAANLERARAVLQESRAQNLPSTDISASGTYGRQSGSALGLNSPGPQGPTYDAGIDVSYEIDLFGRIRRGIEASKADADAAQASLDLARITVAAETARAYADVCSAGRQLAAARESLRVQEGTFDLTRRRVEGG